MKKKSVSTTFKIALSVFVSTLRPKLSFARRDVDEFVKYGIDGAKIDAIEQALDQWANIPTDDELTGAQITATQEKDAAADALVTDMSAILTRASNQYGTHSGHYRKFGVTALSDLANGELNTAAKRMKRVAETHLADLASQGLTQEIIDTMERKRVVFEHALAKQEDAIADRDIASETRVEKANALYQQFTMLCQTGKQLWVNTNEAKYNDYIIYDTPSGKKEETATATAKEA